MEKTITFDQAKKKATKLLQDLKDKANRNPDIFCENYGQNELRKFEDKLSGLHYTEKCDVMKILYPISSFSPARKGFSFFS